MKRLEVAIAIVCRLGKILIAQRNDSTNFAGCWEFPGGKVEPGETPQQCAVREALEEVGITIRAAKALPPIDHDYPTLRVRLHPFICDHVAGEPQPIQVQQTRWISPDQLPLYRFPEANGELLEQVMKELANQS